MVSPSTVHPSTEAAVAAGDRGFVPEQTAYVGSSPAGAGGSTSTRFGSSVVAGTLLTLSLFAWSYLLMLGCHVGVTAGGAISLGWGAAVWIFITGCVTYYFGGMLSNCLSPPVYGGLAKGAAVWALSIPLTLVILAFVAGGAGILAEVNTPAVASGGMTNNAIVHQGLNYGVLWTLILTMAAGLVCSLLGSWAMVRAGAGRYEDR